MTTAESARTIAQASASVPGSCGELAQGMIDGEYFLVSCPVDMYSTATVYLSNGRGRVDAPPDAPKSRRAVELTLAHFGRFDVDVSLTLSGPLPRGKGMASSTADISASIAATIAALGEESAMPPGEIARIALLIEPSDGVMLPGLARFDHRQGRVADTLGTPPPMRVVALDFGGAVDTLDFNSVNREDTLRRLQPTFEEALDLITHGIERGRADEIASGATLSAVSNQKLLHKPQLDAVLRLSDDVGALGVNAAHSGTVLGMLFEDDPELTQFAVSRALSELPGLKQIYDCRLVEGGIFPRDKKSSKIQETR
ncbi:MAG: GHMP kinase [Dehalococcoidia bacterium]|nr:GHMP kinase [Dehalococcoidia bacterium]